MSVQITYLYNTAATFDFSTSVIGITSSAAELRDQVLQIGDGNGTLHANYASGVAPNWGDGTLAGALIGGATVTGGVLDCKGGVTAAASYEALSKINPIRGAVRVNYIPDYSGQPAADATIFQYSDTSGSNAHLLRLKHDTAGAWRVLSYNAAGSAILQNNVGFSSLSLTSGQSYELEYNWDFENGVHQLFVDGAIQGATNTASSSARDDTIGAVNYLQVGGDSFSDADFDDLVAFKTVQHTAAYTSGATIPATRFATTDPSIEVASGFGTDGITSFTDSATATGSDSITYILNVSGTDKYWNGSAWVDSDCSLAQSNSQSDINTNISSLDLSAGATVKLKALLHSDDGSTTPALTSTTFAYDFFVDVPAEPTKCVVYAFLRDIMGSNITNSLSTAQLIVEAKAFEHTNIIVGNQTRVYNFDSDGRVETSKAYLATADTTADDGVIESATPSKSPYKFTVRYKNGSKEEQFRFSDVQVPNTTSASLIDIGTL